MTLWQPALGRLPGEVLGELQAIYRTFAESPKVCCFFRRTRLKYCILSFNDDPA